MVIRQSIVMALVIMMTLLECSLSQMSSPAVVETKHVNVGKSVILECTVSKSHAMQVSWEFQTHNFTIYQGGTLMTDNPTKYSIIRPPDSLAYNLQILEVEKSDQGYYQCRDEISGATNTFQLDVIEKINLPLNTNPGILNVTDCCVALNISSECHPACVPSTVTDDFDPLFSCGMDGVDGLVNLVHCLTAGSNHENCCRFRGINPLCVPFCRNEIPETLGLQHAECVEQPAFDILASCATEGFATLPNEPQDVSVIAHRNEEMNYIQVSWKQPTRNADKVTGYKIMYKRDDMNKYFSTVINDPTTHYARLHGLNIVSNKGYDVHVAALAEHGSSGASVEVSIFIPDASLNDEQNKNIDACCSDRKVSENCRSKLCRSKTWSSLDVDFLSECFDSLDDVFTCLVGERDHTSCCSAFDVAPVCLPICSGHPPPFNGSLIICAQQLAIIEACAQQGYGSLPAPPNHLELKTVGSDEATLTFDPSTSIGVKRFVILLRTGEAEDAKYVNMGSLDPADSVFALADLVPNTYYSVHLTAETEMYGSLPSDTVHFLTYPASFENPTPAPVTNVAHNFTECCYSKGMPDVCAEGCKYVQDISSYYSNHLNDCYSHIGTVLSCGADGRDHAKCCTLRNVSDPDCLSLCGLAEDGPLNNKYIKCLMDTPKAVACFQEGIKTLPRYPDAFVSQVTQNTISLAWIHPPTSTKIDTYIVRYRQVRKAQFLEEKTNNTLFILHNLLPSTEYEISIQSQNDNGISATSPIIRQYTENSNNPKPSFNRTEVTGRQYWTNLTDCCQSSGIPTECVDQCLNKQTSSLDTNNCIFHSHKMLACYADGKDHGECCKENPGLPATCVAICRGHTMELSVDTAICMGHGFKDIIFSCYMRNRGLIPSTPMNVYVVLKELMKIEVTWKKPDDYCGDDCQSIIHYWREDPRDPSVRLNVQTKMGVTSPYELKVTGPEGFYTFTVTARNTYGSSRPSSLRTLYVSPFSKQVKVTLDSNLPFVERGWNVVLRCAAMDFDPSDPYKIKWMFNTNEVKTSSLSEHELHVTNIDPSKNEGIYTCVVSDSNRVVKDSLFLPIKYAPKYFDNIDVTGLPDEGRQATAACLFNGLPDSPGNWAKDGDRFLYEPTKHSMMRDINYVTGLTTYKLKIANLVTDDFGRYTLSVSNKFGSASCGLDIKDPRDLPNILPAPKVPDPKACCAAEGVSELCQELCSFDVDVAEIVEDSKYKTCLTVFDSLIKCGADGKDHRPCCKSKGVKPFCYPFCFGKSPGSHITEQIKLLECVSEASDIFTCMESGQKLHPYPPTSVEALWWESDTSIQVRWSRPQFNHGLVQSYVIYYKGSSDTTERHHGVNNHVLEYIIPKTKRTDKYEISVVAMGKEGRSSQRSYVTIEPLYLAPPTNIRYKVSGLSVTISWIPPSNANEKSKYVVHYKKQDSTRYLNTQEITRYSYTLTQLEPLTDYDAYVTSLSEKNYQSSQSQNVLFKTGGATKPQPNPEAKKKGDDDESDKVAVGVGVAVAIIAVVAIGIIIFVVLKGRGAFRSSNDAVAFENPIAGNPGGVKIHGVGGGADEQFNYGRLEEDQVYDNGNNASSPPVAASFDGAYENPTYSSIEETEGTQNGAATLQVSTEADA